MILNVTNGTTRTNKNESLLLWDRVRKIRYSMLTFWYRRARENTFNPLLQLIHQQSTVESLQTPMGNGAYIGHVSHQTIPGSLVRWSARRNPESCCIISAQYIIFPPNKKAVGFNQKKRENVFLILTFRSSNGLKRPANYLALKSNKIIL